MVHLLLHLLLYAMPLTKEQQFISRQLKARDMGIERKPRTAINKAILDKIDSADNQGQEEEATNKGCKRPQKEDHAVKCFEVAVRQTKVKQGPLPLDPPGLCTTSDTVVTGPKPLGDPDNLPDKVNREAANRLRGEEWLARKALLALAEERGERFAWEADVPWDFLFGVIAYFKQEEFEDMEIKELGERHSLAAGRFAKQYCWARRAEREAAEFRMRAECLALQFKQEAEIQLLRDAECYATRTIYPECRVCQPCKRYKVSSHELHCPGHSAMYKNLLKRVMALGGH